MSKANDKYESILQSSIGMFVEKGFGKTKIADIAKEAGIGKGTVYEYFDSKDDIFKGCIEYLLKKHLDGVVKAVDKGNNLSECMSGLTMIHLDFMKENGNALYFFRKECKDAVGAEIIQFITDYRVKLLKTLERAIDEKSNITQDHPLDSKKLALVFLGSVNQYIVDSLLFDCDTKKEELCDEMTVFIDNLIKMLNL